MRREGNPQSKKLIEDVFEVCDRKWRGVGLIPKSGYKLRPEYRDYDAERLFEVDHLETQESSVCISGQILRGLKKPHECPAFGKECTPQSRSGPRWSRPRGRARPITLTAVVWRAERREPPGDE